MTCAGQALCVFSTKIIRQKPGGARHYKEALQRITMNPMLCLNAMI